jgi:hypothetical protein
MAMPDAGVMAHLSGDFAYGRYFSDHAEVSAGRADQRHGVFYGGE